MNRHPKQPPHEAPKKRNSRLLPRNASAAGIAVAFGAVLILTAGPDGFAQTVSGNPAEVSLDGRGAWVRFRLHDGHARAVQLAGSFSQWKPRYSLRRDGRGNWTVAVRLRPGRYEYVFVVEGQKWIADPAARGVQEDGFGGRNSVIVVTVGGQKGGVYVDNN